MVLVPSTLDEWASLYKSLTAIGGAMQPALLQSIFDEEYLLHTLDLFLAAPDPLASEVLAPIEKFFGMVGSAVIQTRIIDLCFQPEQELEYSGLLVLLNTVSDMRMWDQLARFAQSDRIELQRAGASIACQQIEFGMPSVEQAYEMLNYFRSLQDEWVQENITRADKELRPGLNKLYFGPSSYGQGHDFSDKVLHGTLSEILQHHAEMIGHELTVIIHMDAEPDLSAKEAREPSSGSTLG